MGFPSKEKFLEHYPHYVDKTVGTEKHEEKEIRFVYWGRNLRSRKIEDVFKEVYEHYFNVKVTVTRKESRSTGKLNY